MRKLQVLQLSCQPPYPPDEGGKIRTFQLLQGLRQIADITLVCFQRLPRETAAIEALRGLGYTVTPVPVPSYNPRWWHHLRSTDPLLVQRYGPKTLMDAARVHLARARYDVVVVDGPDACLASVGIERTNGVPLIYHAHNVETEVYRRCLAVGERSLKSRIAAGLDLLKFERFERNRVSHFPDIVTVSTRDAVTLRSWAPTATVKFIPNGADCAYLAPLDIPPVPGAIIFIGTLAYAPNRDAVEYFAAKILPRIRQAVPHATLYVVGRPVADLERSLRDTPGIVFTGYVDDIRPHLARAQVIAVPLRAGGGSRVKILEAMAMRRPIVSTTLGAEGLDFTSGEHLLIADGDEPFADAVIRLLRDPATAERIAEQGRQVILAHHDSRSITRTYVDYVQEICAAAPNRETHDALAS